MVSVNGVRVLVCVGVCVCVLQTRCCDRIPCHRQRISEQYQWTSLQCLWKCCGRQKHRWSLGDKSDGLRNRKTALRHLPSSGVLSQLLVLQREGVMMPSVARFHTSQPDNRRSVLQSTKEVLIASFEVLDIPWCVWDSLLRASLYNTKPREEPFILSGWHVLKLRERPSYPGLLQQTKRGFITLNRRQRVNGTILHLVAKKI
jgi:hypothetical protein